MYSREPESRRSGSGYPGRISTNNGPALLMKKPVPTNGLNT